MSVLLNHAKFAYEDSYGHTQAEHVGEGIAVGAYAVAAAMAEALGRSLVFYNSDAPDNSVTATDLHESLLQSFNEIPTSPLWSTPKSIISYTSPGGEDRGINVWWSRRSTDNVIVVACDIVTECMMGGWPIDLWFIVP